MSRFFRAQGDSDSESESSSSEEELLMSDDDDAPAKPAPGAAPAKVPMSRFLKTAGGSSSSSSDDSDEDEESDDDEDEAPKKSGMGRFRKDASDDEDSDEDVKKVVKSARDKRIDEMEATGKSVDNALKINDWTAVQNEFDKLTRMVQRQQNMSEPLPSYFIKQVLSLETSVNDAQAKEKESKKKMNALNARALTAMKQKVKKAQKEYEKEFKAYQADPEAFEREYNAAVAPEVAAPKPKKAAARAAAADEEEGEDDGFETVGKGGKANVYSAEGILKNLAAIQEARGKKNTDRADQIRVLEKLLAVAATPYQRIRVLLALVASRFDYNASLSSYMPVELWTKAQHEIDQLIQILASDSAYIVQESVADYDEQLERSPETETGGIVKIRGSVISFIDRLDDEFTRSLQNIDPHGTEYVDRLKDEKGLYCTICRAQALCERRGQVDPLARVVMRRIEHIYSKPDAVLTALEAAAAASAEDQLPKATLAGSGSPQALVHALCVHLYQSGNILLRTRAMLSHIYHHALHNDFHTARDMLLMSHLQETIHSADVATQILYNRAVVQLGLAAFRVGLIKEAQATLHDIFASQRVKELLAQGVQNQKFHTLTPEQERAERARQLPFHMHVNTELLEAAFLVASMLVEIPKLASIESEDERRRTVSKPFRRLLDFADRQVFTGPPESTRDHIMQAAKALQAGKWSECRDLVNSIEIWNLMPGSEGVKEMLAARIQEEGLRTYLFTFAPHYSTLSLALLASTFDLDTKKVVAIASRMIWNEELAASIDTGKNVLVFHRVELQRAQSLAVALAERVGALADSNEKALDVRTGNWGEKGKERGERGEG
ncbi:unnamed protein product, partial [Peniophora sp. CBMAI 1063]